MEKYEVFASIVCAKPESLPLFLPFQIEKRRVRLSPQIWE